MPANRPSATEVYGNDDDGDGDNNNGDDDVFETATDSDPITLWTGPAKTEGRKSIVDSLLSEIYHRGQRRGSSCVEDSDALTDPSPSPINYSTNFVIRPHTRVGLSRKCPAELGLLSAHLRHQFREQIHQLVHHLSRRDRLLIKRDRQYDVITAILQAASPKRLWESVRGRLSRQALSRQLVTCFGRGSRWDGGRRRRSSSSNGSSIPTHRSIHLAMSGLFNSLKHLSMPSLSSALREAGSRATGVDTRMRFSVSPRGGDTGFMQWHDAMKMVARLPGGIPADFRKRLWLTMADKHLQSRHVDWEQVKRVCFNERSNPDDDELGTQIVKDLHRTGCSLFCGEDAQPNQALLKRVLLAYARWNKVVGYCQGFNMLAALILEVTEWCDENALKVMIYLIEGVLPESYFANNLRGLSVDMAVFRDLLRLRLPNLSRHLDSLQADARETVSGASYEPPLTNVFTMQWFLTLFSNCLPKSTVLRVWDLIFLEGNEVLLRTALAIWDGLADRIMTVESADEFYSIMRVLTREMLEFGLMDANNLVKTVCSMAPFPFPQLAELRDKYTYNITPFTAALGLAKRAGFHLFHSDDEDEEDDHQMAVAAWCFSSVLPHQMAAIKAKGEARGSVSGPSSSVGPTNFTALGPGAFGPSSAVYPAPTHSGNDNERMSLDISALKKQYAKLRERQKQAHIILTAARNPHPSPNRMAPIAVNHLLVGKMPLTSKRSHLHKGTVRLVMQNKPCKKETVRRPHKASSPTESGETLRWNKAKERRLSLQDIDLIRLSKSKKEDDDSSSTSTELCDDDQGTLSDLDSDADKLEKIKSTLHDIQYETNQITESILKIDITCDGFEAAHEEHSESSQHLPVTPLESPSSGRTSGPDAVGFSSEEDLKCEWPVHEEDMETVDCKEGSGHCTVPRETHKLVDCQAPDNEIHSADGSAVSCNAEISFGSCDAHQCDQQQLLTGNEDERSESGERHQSQLSISDSDTTNNARLNENYITDCLSKLDSFETPLSFLTSPALTTTEMLQLETQMRKNGFLTADLEDSYLCADAETTAANLDSFSVIKQTVETATEEDLSNEPLWQKPERRQTESCSTQESTQTGSTNIWTDVGEECSLDGSKNSDLEESDCLKDELNCRTYSVACAQAQLSPKSTSTSTSTSTSPVISNHSSHNFGSGREEFIHRRNSTLSSQSSAVSVNDPGEDDSDGQKTKNLVGNISLRSPTMPITFNPFPTSKRSPSKLPSQVGIKLGMYDHCNSNTRSRSSSNSSKTLSPLKKKFFWS